MPGKLPIDRMRAAEHAPRIYEQDKQRLTEQQATLRDPEQPRDGVADAPAGRAGREPDDA